MRRVLILAAAFLVGCPPQTIPKLPPATQFYFPTGIVHVDRPDGGGEGALYVASANFDKRFDFGSVMAVDLNRIGMPDFGAPVDGGVARQITDLMIDPESMVRIASFGGELAALPMPNGVRLFIPTRSEGHRLYAIEAPSAPSATGFPRLLCFTRTEGGPNEDCTVSGFSFVLNERSETGVPRAPSPIGVAVSPPPKREVWVTALQQADSPRGSTLGVRGYVVHVNGDNPIVLDRNFVNVGPGGTSSVVVSDGYAYATGRIYAASVPASLVRAIDTTTYETINTSLENTFTAFEGRGAALSSDGKRLYVVGRSPDTLLVTSVKGNDVRVMRTVPLPEGPSLVTTIKREGKSDLVVITCSTSGVVAFYDDEVGNLVAQISGVGLQPFAMAVDTRASSAVPPDASGGARLYVTNFTDGRVTVIDVPELSRPASAKIVAFLGNTQLCITRGANERGCDGGVQ